MSVVSQIMGGKAEPVIITGHSKGGAEALICARLLAERGWPIVAVVTFGGPRVGDAVWKAGYNGQASNSQSSIANSQGSSVNGQASIGNGQSAMANGQTLGDVTQRWVHEEDVVARVPPWIMGYRHVGHEDFLSAFGGVEVDAPLWRLAASDLWGTFWGYKAGRIEQFGDHPIGKYQEQLNQL